MEIPTPMSSDYYNNIRQDIFKHIEVGKHSILDVGCGGGTLGCYLKQNGCAEEVVGIEIDEQAISEAATKLDKVLCANLNVTMVSDVLKDFGEAHFDYIVCADVLEHLVDPWGVLSDLLKFLKTDGCVVVSMPNVRHWSVWLPLILRGHWEYRDSGIMDRTHLRFFTKSSAIKLLSKNGLDVCIYEPLMNGKWRLLNNLFMGLLQELVSVQLVFVCRHQNKSNIINK